MIFNAARPILPIPFIATFAIRRPPLIPFPVSGFQFSVELLVA
jgi:hypothetical protein